MAYLSKVDTSKPLRMKICKPCGKPFVPWRTTQKVCSRPCAEALVYIKKAKQAARDLATGRIEQMTLRQWLNKAQVVINKYVRLRDRNLGCCSCDKPSTWTGGDWHASHYRAVGSTSGHWLRFNLWNISRGCSQCNLFLSGNREGYTPRQLAKIGAERFEYINQPPPAGHKFTIEYAQRIIVIFTIKVKRLERRIKAE